MKTHKQNSWGGEDGNIRRIMKEIENFSASNMGWREKKELENKRVVSLGGKPTKQQSLPLSVARRVMKNRNKRERKLQQDRDMMQHFEGKFGTSERKSSKRRDGRHHKSTSNVLKPSEGVFRNGVLDVRHLLPTRPHTTANGGIIKATGKHPRLNSKIDT